METWPREFLGIRNYFGWNMQTVRFTQSVSENLSLEVHTRRCPRSASCRRIVTRRCLCCANNIYIYIYIYSALYIMDIFVTVKSYSCKKQFVFYSKACRCARGNFAKVLFRWNIHVLAFCLSSNIRRNFFSCSNFSARAFQCSTCADAMVTNHT